MMENAKIINNFFINEKENKAKRQGRRTPTIVKETREIVGTENGKSLELTNCKAYKIIIDNQIYEEKDFKKLFPNRYNSFNIKKTYRSKESREKTCFEEVLYFYFPIQMIQDHSIKVVCRKKMLEITYVL